MTSVCAKWLKYDDSIRAGDTMNTEPDERRFWRTAAESMKELDGASSRERQLAEKLLSAIDDLDAADAQNAVLREQLERVLAAYEKADPQPWEGFYSAEIRAALSTDAGAALLKERDELKARLAEVEREREIAHEELRRSHEEEVDIVLSLEQAKKQVELERDQMLVALRGILREGLTGTWRLLVRSIPGVLPSDPEGEKK